MAGRLTFALAAAFFLVPLSTLSVAQTRGGFHRSATFVPGYRSGRYASSFGHHRSAYASGYFFGDPPFFYDEYPAAVPEQDAQPLIVSQRSAAFDEPPQPKASPLLIELVGGRYVRYGGVEQTGSGQSRAGQSEERNASVASHEEKAPQTPFTPTALVYRDGHREEIRDYAIVGRVLYAHSSDVESSYGMKAIQLSALDLAATIRTNRENGVNFILPNGPNEVVTRP